MNCMKHVLLLLSCAALGASALGAGVDDHAFYRRAKAEARLLPIRPIGDRAIRIDGDLSDWGDMRQDSFAMHQLLDHTVPGFHQSWKQKWEDKATDAALIKLIHSNDALYIAIKVADNVVVAPADEKKRLHGDVVDMYLDLRPLAGERPTTGHAKYTEGMYQLVFAPPSPEGVPIHILQPENQMFTGWRAGQTTPRLGPFEAKAGLFKGGYAIEIRLPLASFPHRPAADRLRRPIGFEVMIADKDAERPKGQPDRMYYSCSGYSGGGNYFKNPATIACTDPNLRAALPLSRLRRNPLKTAPGGDECEGWIAAALGEKDVAAAFVKASKTVAGYAQDAKKKPLVTYPCPALDLAFHHRNVLSRLPASAPAAVGNRYVAVHPAAGQKIVIDGNLADWQDFAATAAQLYQYGSMEWCTGLSNRTDSAMIKVMCEKDTLYVGVQVQDDVVINPGAAAKRFVGDGVQVFLDVRAPDAKPNPMSHGKYSDGVYHFYLAPPTDDGQQAAFSQGPQKVRRAGAIKQSATRQRGGYVVEMAIPLASLLDGPASGRFQRPFGFEMVVTDIDRRGKSGPLEPLVTYSWCGSAEERYHDNPAHFNCADYLPNRLPEVRSLMDATPASVTVDFSSRRHRFSGFGGNYKTAGSLSHTGGRSSVYGPMAASTLYVAQNMNFKWARVNLDLFTWEWVNDNDSPDQTDMSRFKTTVGQPGHEHRTDSGPGYKRIVDQHLALIKQWMSKDTRLCAYAGSFPPWLSPPKGKARGRTFPAELWPEFAECLTSYMAYAKEEHGVEFAYFALKDPRWGFPSFDDKAYPAILKLLGAAFAKQGLQTKLLLCDTTHINNFRWHANFANDPGLLKYVGGVGIETAGALGPQMATYRLWRDLAEHMDKPLFITSFGRPYTSSPTYLFEEIRIWQTMINELKPNAAMIKQFVAEKSNKWIMLHGKQVVQDKKRGVPSIRFTTIADKPEDVLPNLRFWMTKQFCELTPPGHVVDAGSDHPQVLASAFTGGRQGREVHTVHVANAGPARQAAISGLPGDLESMQVIRSGSGEGFHRAGQVKVVKGKATLDLPAWSLVSFTTMPPQR